MSVCSIFVCPNSGIACTVSILTCAQMLMHLMNIPLICNGLGLSLGCIVMRFRRRYSLQAFYTTVQNDNVFCTLSLTHSLSLCLCLSLSLSVSLSSPSVSLSVCLSVSVSVCVSLSFPPVAFHCCLIHFRCSRCLVSYVLL